MCWCGMNPYVSGSCGSSGCVEPKVGHFIFEPAPFPFVPPGGCNPPPAMAPVTLEIGCAPFNPQEEIVSLKLRVYKLETLLERMMEMAKEHFGFE